MPAVLFDITRLAWRARRDSPTGIDRVLIAYGRWLLSRTDIDLVPVAQVGGRLVEIPRRRFERLLRQSQSASPDSNRQWEALTAALRAGPGGAKPVRRPVAATGAGDWLPLGLDFTYRCLRRLWGEPSGDIYLNVAHLGLEHPTLLARLAARGMRPVVMVHDLIPITHPEFCAPAAERKHAKRMQNLEYAWLVLANSQSTADDIARYCARTPPVLVARLGLEASFRKTDEIAAPVPYFVCVGTIEARKNLAFLLMVWRELAKTSGAAAPRLVLVGRRGWENEAVIDQLERSAVAGALVHEVADLTDDQLARLIGGARALLAPSLAEGYDLPPLEALAVGTPVIASDIAAHRELAEGARLVGALDGPGWIEAIQAACQTRQPGRPWTAPSWEDHFALVASRLLAP